MEFFTKCPQYKNANIDKVALFWLCNLKLTRLPMKSVALKCIYVGIYGNTKLALMALLPMLYVCNIVD